MKDRVVRRFVFTAHDWKLHDNFLYALHNLPFCYIIYGEEQGEGGSPHLQGYVELKKQMRISTLNKFTFKRMWISAAKTQHAAIEYCKKEGNYHEYGTPRRCANKIETAYVVDCAKDNVPLRDILHDDPGLWRAAGRYEQLRRSLQQPYVGPRRVVWLYGRPGSGKTRTAYDVCMDLFPGDFHMQSNDLQDFYGYDGQSCVILDDYRCCLGQFVLLLRLLDRYPCYVNVKFGNVPWQARTIFVTAPSQPKNSFQGVYEDLEQVNRRIDKIIELSEYSLDVVTELKEYITLTDSVTPLQ